MRIAYERITPHEFTRLSPTEKRILVKDAHEKQCTLGVCHCLGGLKSLSASPERPGLSKSMSGGSISPLREGGTPAGSPVFASSPLPMQQASTSSPSASIFASPAGSRVVTPAPGVRSPFAAQSGFAGGAESPLMSPLTSPVAASPVVSPTASARLVMRPRADSPAGSGYTSKGSYYSPTRQPIVPLEHYAKTVPRFPMSGYRSSVPRGAGVLLALGT